MSKHIAVTLGVIVQLCIIGLNLLCTLSKHIEPCLKKKTGVVVVIMDRTHPNGVSASRFVSFFMFRLLQLSYTRANYRLYSC
jgi:hypothetical protein